MAYEFEKIEVGERKINVPDWVYFFDQPVAVKTGEVDRKIIALDKDPEEFRSSDDTGIGMVAVVETIEGRSNMQTINVYSAVQCVAGYIMGHNVCFGMALLESPSEVQEIEGLAVEHTSQFLKALINQQSSLGGPATQS